MTDVVLFHHALGRTAGIEQFAAELRSAGHVVHVPDLFEGRTFATLEQGMAHVEEVGFAEVVARGERSVADLPPAMVYGGFSLGVLPAQKLAQTRPGALGAWLCYACVPAAEFGGWPAHVPVQVHGMDRDPIFAGEGDLEAAQELVTLAESGELFLYPGDAHYFADPTLATYDPEAAGLLLARAVAFLASV